MFLSIVNYIDLINEYIYDIYKQINTFYYI